MYSRRCSPKPAYETAYRCHLRVTAGFVFGVFPGWWRADQDGRLLSPNITISEWDKLLRQNGFFGVDIVFKDFEHETAHHLGWIITTAVESNPSPLLVVDSSDGVQVTIIVDEDCPQQYSLAKALSCPIREIVGFAPQIQNLDSSTISSITTDGNHFVILLLDYGSSFIQSFREVTWSQIQSVVRRSHRILWVSAGGGRAPKSDHGLLDGLARTLRSEFYELHLVTLALDILGLAINKTFLIAQIVKEMIARPAGLPPYEQEYLEIDGRLYIRRLTEARYIKTEMDARLVSH